MLIQNLTPSVCCGIIMISLAGQGSISSRRTTYYAS